MENTMAQNSWMYQGNMWNDDNAEDYDQLAQENENSFAPMMFVKNETDDDIRSSVTNLMMPQFRLPSPPPVAAAVAPVIKTEKVETRSQQLQQQQQQQQRVATAELSDVEEEEAQEEMEAEEEYAEEEYDDDDSSVHAVGVPTSPKDESSISESDGMANYTSAPGTGATGLGSRRMLHHCPAFLPQKEYTVEEIRGILASGSYNAKQQKQLRDYLKILYNRHSASVSRVRRRQLLGQLEADIEAMTATDSELSDKITELAIENKVLKEQLTRMRRIIKSTALSRLANFNPETITEDPEQTVRQMVVLAFAHFLSMNPTMVPQFARVATSPTHVPCKS